MKWGIFAVLIFLFLPFGVYILSKAFTWGRLKATLEFRQYIDKQIQRQTKEEQYENKEKK